MLVKIKCLDYEASYAYAPPSAEFLINSEHVIDVRPCEARGPGPFVRITLSDKRQYVARGTVEEILAELNPRSPNPIEPKS